MESRKSFIIIDMDNKRSERTLEKFKKANIKARSIKSRPEIDEVVRNGGIQALLISPQVVGDVTKLKELYHVPVFVIGEVEPTYLPKVYQSDITDMFPSDFKLGFLLERLGQEYVEPISTVSYPKPLPSRSQNQSLSRTTKPTRQQTPKRESVDFGDTLEEVNDKKKSKSSLKSLFSKLNSPIGK